MPVTLQIELPDAEATSLLEEAGRQGVSVGELLQRWVHEQLARPSDDASVGRDADPLWSIAGLARTGVTDASAEHDRYLYDETT